MKAILPNAFLATEICELMYEHDPDTLNEINNVTKKENESE
ncbi:hypothetical protein [Priestia megaterium]